MINVKNCDECGFRSYCKSKDRWYAYGGLECSNIWSKDKDIVCPFCGEKDFDASGLKYHLQNYCQIYKDTQ